MPRLGADVGWKQIALARHAQVEGTDVAEEPVQVLCADRVVSEWRRAALGVDLGAGGRGCEILQADGPVRTAMAA